MAVIVTVLIVSVLVAAFVLCVAAYPSQRHRVQAAPAPEQVKDAVDRVGEKVTRLLEDASARR